MRFPLYNRAENNRLLQISGQMDTFGDHVKLTEEYSAAESKSKKLRREQVLTALHHSHLFMDPQWHIKVVPESGGHHAERAALASPS
jgi:hypothetical protein